MNTLDLSILSTLPLFPTEILAEILQSPTLYRFDLARCCRVNSTFLALAQPLLYHTLTLDLYTRDLETENDGWTVELFDGSSPQLFRTLRENPSIARLPRSLWICAEIETERQVEEDLVFDYREDAIQYFLELMPRVESLKINGMMWRSREVQEVVFSNCEKWTEFDLFEDLLEEEVGGDLSKWINLQKLRCYGIEFSKPPGGVLPDNLENLDLYFRSQENCLEPGHFSPNSQLRILRISSSDLTLSVISILPRLEQLHFYAAPGYPRTLSSSTLSSFAKLPRLRLLSFRFNFATNSNTSPLELLSYLPPTLDRLEFPEYIPFQPLLAFLNDPNPSSIRTIGIARRTTSISEIAIEMKELFSACRTKNIQIDYISPD